MVVRGESLLDDPTDPIFDSFRALRGRTDRHSETFVAESEMVLDRLIGSRFEVLRVLTTPAREQRVRDRLRNGRSATVELLVAPQSVVDAVVGYPLHRGVVALGRRRPTPTVDDVLANAHTILVAEEVSDPDNIGALFRHAAGFGVDAIVLSGATADPLYRKTIRVSMGWTLMIPFALHDHENEPIATVLERHDATSLALTPRGSTSLHDAVGSLDPDARVALLVGAEGPGLRPETIATASSSVRIPIAEGVDSFNVATAGAIALYALTTAHPNRLRDR